jgi:hypothetical protein
MSQQKLLLDMDAITEDFFSDSSIIGIVSTAPAYYFVWLLNNHFDLKLVREPEMDIPKKDIDKKEHFFSVYKYSAPLNGNKYTVYKLKSETETLLPEAKQLDYILMIQSTDSLTDAEQFTQQLKNIQDIQLAQVIDIDSLKSLSNLIL